MDNEKQKTCSHDYTKIIKSAEICLNCGKLLQAMSPIQSYYAFFGPFGHSTVTFNKVFPDADKFENKESFVKRLEQNRDIVKRLIK